MRRDATQARGVRSWWDWVVVLVIVVGGDGGVGAAVVVVGCWRVELKV